MAREVKRINISVPLDTLDRLDDYADRMSINRTSAILVLVNQALDAQKGINTLDELLRMVKENENKAV